MHHSCPCWHAARPLFPFLVKTIMFFMLITLIVVVAIVVTYIARQTNKESRDDTSNN
ncbi:hypothetical protein LX64_02333 [Chitinophaga skermanii]|uniref:Uncharacterized protein n=1 Tax=Chitinophaga skermanii TaxID=331697 RepID=A0A327QKW6_9BACT|nr:hypothetical protein LX64_02333 [Chitinophaga skermanii]